MANPTYDPLLNFFNPIGNAFTIGAHLKKKENTVSDPIIGYLNRDN